jgi:serine/threonine-protein phosphatase 2A regulatory subunit B'
LLWILTSELYPRTVPIAVMPPKQKSPSKLPVRRRKPEPKIVPKVELEELKVMTFSISTLFTIGLTSDVAIAPSDAFSKVDPKSINGVFADKCRECSKICDFSTPSKDQSAKQTKKQLLTHFVELFEAQNLIRFVMPSNIKKFIDMIVDNISRPFPSMRKITAFDFGDQVEDLAWPHLVLVYKASLRLFSSKISIAIENNSFVSVLVSNSCSPDSRECQLCRDVLKAVYRKCDVVRSQIVRAIHAQFLTLICSKELLDFYLTVVDALPLPLTPDNITVFKNCVLILHSSFLFHRFCFNLVTVLDHYIRVDAGLLGPTFEYIFAHWPSSTVHKQLIFLDEIEELTQSYSEIITPEIGQSIFRQLAKLVNVPHIEIAEMVLELIWKDSFSMLIAEQAEAAMQILLSPLAAAAKRNWSPNVRENAESCINMFRQLDEALFVDLMNARRDRKKKKKADKQIRNFRWAKVFESAKAHDKSITSVNLGTFLM